MLEPRNHATGTAIFISFALAKPAMWDSRSPKSEVREPGLKPRFIPITTYRAWTTLIVRTPSSQPIEPLLLLHRKRVKMTQKSTDCMILLLSFPKHTECHYSTTAFCKSMTCLNRLVDCQVILVFGKLFCNWNIQQHSLRSKKLNNKPQNPSKTTKPHQIPQWRNNLQREMMCVHRYYKMGCHLEKS